MDDKTNNPCDLPESQEEITIPIKFNKETKELTIEQAVELAQKGLKFESIEKDFSALKELASKENRSVSAFISELCDRKQTERQQSLTEQCGGNEEMAKKILELEGNDRSLGFEELKEAFPKFTKPEDLPDELLENARLKGTLLLDEYLRYLLNQERNAKAIAHKQHQAEASSTGSLADFKGSHNPETEEFLRGLWK